MNWRTRSATEDAKNIMYILYRSLLIFLFPGGGEVFKTFCQPLTLLSPLSAFASPIHERRPRFLRLLRKRILVPCFARQIDRAAGALP